MTARLGALRDDDVSTCTDSLLDVCEVLTLANEDCASLFDLVGELSRIAKRQHHSSRTKLEGFGHNARRPLR
jgi:hypothetical protein